MSNQNLLPNLRDFQFLPPFKDDVKFEEFMTDFFNSLEATQSFDRYGRSGQKQDGLDIFSEEKKTIIQCKLKQIGRTDTKISKELLSNLDTDFKAFTKYNKSQGNKFSKFIFATTFKSDTAIQNACISKSTKGVKIEYWHWERILSEATDTIKSKYFSFLLGEVDEYYSSSSKKPNILSIDKKLPILEQLHQYFNITSKELDKLPNHILAKHYPFRTDADDFSYYKRFNLTINNSHIFDFINSLTISSGKINFKNKSFVAGVSSYDTKTKAVLSKLRNNLVYGINLGREKHIQIKGLDSKRCECVRCRLNRLEFDKGFPMLNGRATSIKTKMKMAYTNYQFGNYVKAAKAFIKIGEEAKQDNLRILHFICNYNLVKLKVFIRNNYWADNAQTELINEINRINLDVLAIRLKDSPDAEIINWIRDSDFYSSTRNKILLSKAKIIDHYYLQENGGWSSADDVYELINDYADLDLFLNANFIVYDNFSDFSEATKDFTEGLIASLAMNDEQTQQLKSFDDWIMRKLVLYGHAESILKFARRYNVKEITYKKSTSKSESDDFLSIVKNFLSNKNIESNFKKYCEKDNRFFWTKHNFIFENLLVLLSLIDLPVNEVNEIMALLIPYLKSDDNLYIDKTGRIAGFLKKHGKLIPKSDLVNFLKVALVTKNLHREEIIVSIIEAIEDHHGPIKLAKKYYKLIESMCFKKCPKCNHRHSPDIATHIYRIADTSTIKKEISGLLQKELESKFDDNLFYLAAIWDIITVDKNSLNKFISTNLPSPHRSSFRESMGGRKDEMLHYVNRLLNLCFKEGIKLSDKRFDAFREVNDYYGWLFNLKGFNYDLFQPVWVTKYATKYFIKEFRKHIVIKEKLVAYLKKNNDPLVEKTFLNIYYKLPEY